MRGQSLWFEWISGSHHQRTDGSLQSSRKDPDYGYIKPHNSGRVHNHLSRTGAGAVSGTDPVRLMYVDLGPSSSLLKAMCFSMRMLRGEQITVPRRSASALFFNVEGHGETVVDGDVLPWQGCDTMACPSFASVGHRNAASTEPRILFQFDDGPIQYKLDYYEDENLRPQAGAK